MFTQESFVTIGAHSNSSAPRLYSYRTEDSLVDVRQDGYFNEKINQINDGDFINIAASDGVEPRIFVKTGTLTLRTVPSAFENVMLASSKVDQAPSATDTPLQASFGDAQGDSNDPVEIDALGNLKINETSLYTLTAIFSVSRDTAPGECYFFIRFLVNGVQNGNAICAEMSDDEMTVPLSFTRSGVFPAGAILTIEMVRDSQGNNDGGLKTFTSSVGWGSSSSASVRVDKY